MTSASAIAQRWCWAFKKALPSVEKNIYQHYALKWSLLGDFNTEGRAFLNAQHYRW